MLIFKPFFSQFISLSIQFSIEKVLNFSKGVIPFQFPIHLFTYTHIFSPYSHTPFHYTLHPYILYLSYTYKYPLLTTFSLLKTTHQKLYEFPHLNTQITPIPSSSSSSLPKQQKPFISFKQNPQRITSFHPFISFSLTFYFLHLLNFKKDYHHGKNKRIFFQEASH